MDPATPSLQTIARLKWKLVDVFETNVNDLVKETRSFIKRETLDTLDNIHNPAEKVETLLDLIIHEGESASETFLGRLLSLAPGIPNLNSLSAEFPEKKRENFRDLLAQLDMTQYTESKLTLKSVLNIGKNNLKKIECQNLQDAPWYFLRKLVALNQTARNMRHEERNIECISDDADDDLLTYYDNYSIIKNASSSLHPLDVVCALLHCSDHLLQQEIVSKMSMCQFAVPLLLPAGDGTYCTLMLWAMRDIVKRWRPHSLADSKGFMEDNVVNVPMPTFSFVRLGKTKLSKSKILNQVLSQDQNLDFFIHDNMEGGNIERKISNGLVEMSWYFPSGSDSSDIFPEPIAVTNLRGDLESNWNQFSFLTRVSSAVFIFTERIGEREIRILSKCNNSSTKYYFIMSPNPGSDVRETIRHLNKIKSVLKLEGNNIILRRPNDNDTDLVKKIQSSIKSLENYSKNKSVQIMDTLRLGICVDEGSEDFRRARQHAERITEAIRDVIVYKKETLALQGDLWKRLSKTEKEMCRMKNQGAKSGSEYENELKEKCVSLHKKQYNHYSRDPPIGIMSFITAIIAFSNMEKHYFLKWMKLNLDSIIHKNLPELRKEYQEKSEKEIKNKEELKHLEQKISDSSLGIEHFLRETGQFYEAECAKSKEQKISIMKPYNQLPGLAADLLLDGFPLELIDGDVSNIPMQWITDILTELDTKTGGRCRIRVISVLGVQSTGKSTLLNTMFGLQFSVASGRCTRGAFMTLVRVEKDFIEELGCDFILVIDTEGLKAPELDSLEGSYEHDNELATLVIGLSDITIINMAMENMTEMKDILQIVVHAFLRMKEIGKKPKCLFVHQNVNDVSANQNNKRDTKKQLELLDKMTEVAANMENISEITTFNSIIDYDPDNNNWYVPGLWHGVPPMAPVNHGYSETVYKLKMSLCEYLKTCKSLNKPHSIKDFITWIDSLWNAVKHEKFLFSFRNSLVAQAYNKLSIRFSQWEWDFTKAVYSWVSDTETRIRNQSPDTLHTDTLTRYTNDLHRVVNEEEQKMLELLQNYFESESDNMSLIEKYRAEFEISVSFLKKKLERNAFEKWKEAFRVQKDKFGIQRIQNKYHKMIEDKVMDLLKTCGQRNLDDTEMEEEFETMWEKTVTEVNIEPLKKRKVSHEMLDILKQEMSSRGSSVNDKLCKVKDLKDCGQGPYVMDTKKFLSWFSGKAKGKTSQDKLKQLTKSLIETCGKFVTASVSKKSDYESALYKELLGLIDEKLKSDGGKKLPVLFEIDIKLYVSGQAAAKFQKMHEDYIQENDPYVCLQNLKHPYLETFKSIYKEKDQSHRRAHQFCDRCLKPALTQYTYRHLGREIVDDVLNSPENKMFKTRSFFQGTLLKYMLEKGEFDTFREYINSYESFTKEFISTHIKEKYKTSTQLQTLATNLLSDVMKKVQEAFRNQENLKSPNITSLLENICKELNNELVIPQTEVSIVCLGNNVNVSQFSRDVQSFLSDTETRILSELKAESILSEVTEKPEDELLEKVIGCGKQCPFCKVPCEAGGSGHTEHFASIHRPQGLGKVIRGQDNSLTTTICSTSVKSTDTFSTKETDWEPHLCKDYRSFYPDWAIQPDPSLESSDYWKYVFMKFNRQFAEEYGAEPAELPDGWRKITKEQALRSLKEAFNME